MLTIKLRVPADRDRTAVVELLARSVMKVSGIACASADVELAQRHGNAGCDPMRPWGHPPLGTYRFLASGRTPKGCAVEYGSHLLVFQPESGPALQAESFGRLLLPVYAGAPARDGRLRRTQGGLRVEQGMFGVLLARIAKDPDVLLEIGTLQPPVWWRFWRRAERGFPLAPGSPNFITPPLDEISLAEKLAAGKRLVRRGPPQRIDDDFLSSRESERSSGSTSHAGSPYAGRGGESGGAGASGAWDAPRGVDSAGRITAAAAGIAAAAVVAETLASTERADAAPDAAADTGTDTATNY